jgi:hypothetical protein
MIAHDTIDWSYVVALRGCGRFDGAEQDFPDSEMLLPSGAWVHTGMYLASAKKALFEARARRTLLKDRT